MAERNTAEELDDEYEIKSLNNKKEVSINNEANI